MRKLLYTLTVVGLIGVGAYAQQAGGAFFPGFAYTIAGNWAFTGTNTHSGSETFSGTTTLTSPTLTTPTLTSPTITGGTATTTSLGRGVTQTAYRQDFNGPCFKFELADFTAELVTNAGANGAACNGGITTFAYRLDGDQASPFIATGGALDIDNNGADDEGVEIVLADVVDTTQGWVTVGTSPNSYVRASITIASVSGTDNMFFGWRLAAAFVDDIVLETYDTYGVFHVNDAAGNIEIQTGADGTDADDEADANAVWADAETIVLEVRVSTAGVFSFYQDDVLVTVTQATGAADAGDVLVPVLGMLNATDADTELKVNWIEVGQF